MEPQPVQQCPAILSEAVRHWNSRTARALPSPLPLPPLLPPLLLSTLPPPPPPSSLSLRSLTSWSLDVAGRQSVSSRGPLLAGSGKMAPRFQGRFCGRHLPGLELPIQTCCLQAKAQGGQLQLEGGLLCFGIAWRCKLLLGVAGGGELSTNRHGASELSAAKNKNRPEPVQPQTRRYGALPML